MELIKQNQHLDTIANIDLYKVVMQRAYFCLIRYCRLNKQNQKELTSHIFNIFSEDMKFGIGAIQLIGEILRENSSLMTKNYTTIIEDIVELINETDIANI